MEALGRLSRRAIVAVAVVAVAVLAVIDYLTGPYLSCLVFYLIPVMLVTWFVGRKAGLVLCASSAAVWIIVDTVDSLPGAHPIVPYWNVLVKLAFFIVVTYILSALRESLLREHEMARTDSLTQARNERAFCEAAEAEINRVRRYRHPLTVACIDIDNFKQVNDRFGHSAANILLAKVARTLEESLRATDTVARLGGDEFAMLMPETNYEQAQVAVQRLLDNLREAMEKGGWPVTFSIGVMTCSTPPSSVDEALQLTDRLMYAAKADGKNTFKHEVLDEAPSTGTV